MAEFEGVFLSTDKKWYAIAAGWPQRAPALRQPAARCCGFPERLCADSHDKCPTKLNTAAKRAKNCPKASGWNSQKCAATCGTGSEAAAREDDV